jgi:hypothetical protein
MLRAQPQEGNRIRFWGLCPELDGRYLRVVTLADKVTIHNASKKVRLEQLVLSKLPSQVETVAV